MSPGGCLLALLALAWFAVFLVAITKAFAGVERQLGGWVIAGFAILVLLLVSSGGGASRRFAAIIGALAVVALVVPLSVLVSRSRAAERDERQARAQTDAELPGLKRRLGEELASRRWLEARKSVARIRRLEVDDPEVAMAAAALAAESRREALEAAERSRLAAGPRGVGLAREVNADPALCASPKAIARAWGQVRQVRYSDPEWQEAAALVAGLETCRTRVEASLGEQAREGRRRRREEWAVEARARLVGERGAVVAVSVSGAASDELAISWPLMSEAISSQWTGGLSAELTQIGFRRLAWSDGRDGSWSHDLAPAADDALVRQGLGALGLGAPLKLEAPEAP